MLPEGEQFLGRSLPVVLKNYVSQVHGYIVLYAGKEFDVLTLLEMMELYAHCDQSSQDVLKPVLGKL